MFYDNVQIIDDSFVLNRGLVFILEDIILPSTTNTVPDFEIIQSSDKILVFVLDVSGSMKGVLLNT